MKKDGYALFHIGCLPYRIAPESIKIIPAKVPVKKAYPAYFNVLILTRKRFVTAVDKLELIKVIK